MKNYGINSKRGNYATSGQQRYLFHRWSTGNPAPGKTTVITGVSLGADDKNQLFLLANDGTMKPMAIKYSLQETDGVEFPIPK